MSAPWLLLAFVLSAPGSAGVVAPVSAAEETEDGSEASDDVVAPGATAEDQSEAEEVEEDAEDEGEPFPWDMVAGALVMSGGLAAGAGLTAAGIGALFLTAPGADPVIAPGGYVLLGAGAIVGLLGVVVVSTGGGILLFTGDDE